MSRARPLIVALAFLVVPGLALASPAAKNFGTHATGAEEVPARDTRAQGQIILKLNDDGTLDYRLIATNIDNVVASHLHLGAAGTNGPVVVFLFGPAAPGGGRQNGVLATGNIEDSDLIGPMMGQTVADLVAEIEAGNIYVNVHTNDGDTTPNEGPGDFPGGEIRGQVEVHGP
jgi:CHRD domain